MLSWIKKLVKHKSEFIFNVTSWISLAASTFSVSAAAEKNNFLCLLTAKLINTKMFFLTLNFFPFLSKMTQIIAMEDMKVRIAGTMRSIKEVDPKIIREWDAAIAKENAKER